MRTWLLAFIVLGLCIVPLQADLTITHSVAKTGKAAVLMPGGQLPLVKIRIKGKKARTDVETFGQTVTIITDLETREVKMLRPGSTIAQVTTPRLVESRLPFVVSVKPTGRSRMIGGATCDEHSYAMSIDMALLPNPHVPPEVMKGASMLMNGSMWIAKSAPGAAEWIAFSKAALESKLLRAVTGLGSELGMDALVEAALPTAPGIPYLTEMTTHYKGGSGPMANVMKEIGNMKMTHEITSVSTELIAEDLFKLPRGYTIEKR